MPYLVLIALALLIRLLIAGFFPLIGDEPYYLSWGRSLTGGFYDHPPAIAWLLYPFRALAPEGGVLWARAVAIALSFWIAFLFSRILRTERTGDLSVKAYQSWWLWILFAPLHALAMIVSTDTALVFFTVAAGFAFYHLWRHRFSWPLAILLFASSGLAFLSKYFFALVIGAWFVAGILKFRKDRAYWQAFVIAVLGLVAGVFQHLYWNAENCWVNFAFHLKNRFTHHEHFGFGTFFEFLSFQAILIGPWIIWEIGRRILGKRDCLEKRSADAVQTWAAISFLIPVIAFGISSFKYPQGLHWTFSFYPFAYLWAGLALTAASLRRGFQVSIAATLILLGVASVAALKSDDWWRDTVGGAPIRFSRYVILRHPDTLVAFLQKEQDKLVADKGIPPSQVEWGTDSYTTTSTLDFYRGKGRRVWVLGYGTRFGRQFDWNQNYRDWAGKDFLILALNVELAENLKIAFETVERIDVEIKGAHFYYIKALGFKPGAYAAEFQRKAYERYYQLPPETWKLGCPLEP